MHVEFVRIPGQLDNVHMIFLIAYAYGLFSSQIKLLEMHARRVRSDTWSVGQCSHDIFDNVETAVWISSSFLSNLFFFSRGVNNVATRWQPWTTLVTLFDQYTHWGAIILSQFCIQYVRWRIHFSYVKWRQILLLSCLYNNWPWMSGFMENFFWILNVSSHRGMIWVPLVPSQCLASA